MRPQRNESPDGDRRRNVAAVFFNGFFILMAVLFNVVWRIGVAGGRLLGEYAAAASRRFPAAMPPAS